MNSAEHGAERPAMARESAFLFAGQGSQHAGIGIEWQETEAWHLVSRFSDLTGLDLEYLLTKAPDEELESPEISHPVILTYQLVVLRTALERGHRPAVCMGHSLGEYAAAVAAGCLDDGEAMRLALARGKISSAVARQVEGGMTAVLGLRDELVEQICAEVDGVWPANYNASGQVVVSGTWNALSHVGRRYREHRARMWTLAVQGPFHTPLMAPAAESFAAVLRDACIRRPSVALVSNHDAQVHWEPDEWRELLATQLVSPVRWKQSIDSVLNSGVRSFVEVGTSTLRDTVTHADRTADVSVIVTPRLPNGLALDSAVGRADVGPLFPCAVGLLIHGASPSPAAPFSGPLAPRRLAEHVTEARLHLAVAVAADPGVVRAPEGSVLGALAAEGRSAGRSPFQRRRTVVRLQMRASRFRAG